MNNLFDILKGCLYSNTVQQAQNMLAQYSQKPGFLSQLLVLIPNQEPQVMTLIVSTLKNYIIARWSPPPSANLVPVPNDQKLILMDNILNLYYEIKENEQAVNLYKEIAFALVLANYPWPGIDQKLCEDLGSGIFASVTFCRQIAKAYEYSTHPDERAKAENFVTNYFPKLENLIEQCLTSFNQQTSKLICIILKTFFSIMHTELPEYLKNQDNLVKWFVYVKTVLNAQLENNLLNQRIAARILSRLVSQYMNQTLDSKHLKGWSDSLLSRIGQDITDTIFNCLSNPNGDQETASHILDAVMWYARNQKFRHQFLTQQNVNFIIYDRLLPNMETSTSDLQLFNNDPYEYIRKDEDLTSDGFKRNAADTIEHLLNYCVFNGKSLMMSFIEYAANSLQSTASDRHKEVLVRQLTKMSSILKKNKFIQGNFENLAVTYFIPLMRQDAPLLNAEVCRFFAAYLTDLDLSQSTISDLMALIYEKMIGKSMVLKYNAILAFTSLLSQQSALNSAKSHFQDILQIYVKMLDDFDHENLLKCLQSIVGKFSSEIVTFAPNLISHMLNKFHQTCNSQANNDDQEDDGSKQASAALSTIEQILQSPLNEQTYFQISKEIIPLLRQIFDDLQEYFSQILSLVNVLVYKAKSVYDEELLYVLARKLLQGKDCPINVNSVGNDVAILLSKVTEQSDTQYQVSLISILKNQIQKLPDSILHKYPYPVHSELILALIENKRLNENQWGSLNTSLVDNIWTQYLQSYRFVVYGEGSVTSPQGLKAITGVSLYPWIVNYFDVNLVKILLSQIEEQDEEDQDDLLEENTMMMLEKYAKEDQDEQDCDEYYGTQGINYTYFYDSPYDSSKDKDMFIQKLKSLSNDDANALMSMLNSKDQKRIQTLFN